MSAASDSVRNLVGMGFDENRVRQALQASNNDMDLALDSLLSQGSFARPVAPAPPRQPAAMPVAVPVAAAPAHRQNSGANRVPGRGGPMAPVAPNADPVRINIAVPPGPASMDIQPGRPPPQSQAQPGQPGRRAAGSAASAAGAPSPRGPEQHGVVLTVFPEKGYGFIQTNRGQGTFFHFSEVASDFHLQRGDRVAYQVGQNPVNHKDCAVSVRVIQYVDPDQVGSRAEVPKWMRKKRLLNPGGAGSVSPRDPISPAGAAQQPLHSPSSESKQPLPASDRYLGRISHLRSHYGLIMLERLNSEVFFDCADVVAPNAANAAQAVGAIPLTSEQLGLQLDDLVEFAVVREPVIGEVAKHIVIKDNSLSALLPQDLRCVKNTRVARDESRSMEFKSLKTSRSPENAIADHVSKYVNAFLNTEGGTICFGIEDDGTVTGLVLDSATRDIIRRTIDNVIHAFRPAVDPSLYSVHFTLVEPAVHEAKGPERFVVTVTVVKGKAPVYEANDGHAYIKRDGSCYVMPVSMITERTAAASQPADLNQLAKQLFEHLKKGGAGGMASMQAMGAAAAPAGAPAGQASSASTRPVPMDAKMAPAKPVTPVASAAAAAPAPAASAAASSGAQSVALNDEIIQQGIAMGFSRADVLDVLYELQKTSVNPDWNMVLDRLLRR